MTVKPLDLYKRRKELKLPVKKILEYVGIGRQTLYDYENPEKNVKPSADKYKKLLEVLQIKESNDGKIIKFSNNETMPEISDPLKIKLVPILSYVQAGEFSDLSHLNSDELEYIPLPASEVPHNAFLMKVKGDSMVYDYSPTQRLKMEYSKFSINENEFVLVDTNQTNIDCLIGKVMVAHNGHGTTVKLAYEEEQGICLMPLNSRLQNNENIKRPDDARIIGKVIDVINKRNFR